MNQIIKDMYDEEFKYFSQEGLIKLGDEEFLRHLGYLLAHADPNNSKKIISTFYKYCKEYHDKILKYYEENRQNELEYYKKEKEKIDD